MIINMWSGPRNLSTALMRSFENRTDTNVIDEPLYAYYLNCNNINHPMKENIINHYCTNYKEIISQITKNVSSKIFYIKHMAHHIPQNNNLKWISEGKNSLLIRDPKKVLSSYIKKNELKNSKELGYHDQYKIFKYLLKNNEKILIINSEDLILNTEKTLIKLCQKLKIQFDKKMLSWPKGKRNSDGIWGQIWYKNVINSTSFENNKLVKKIVIPNKYQDILKECNEIYEELNSFNLLLE